MAMTSKIAARVIQWQAPDVWGIALELRDGRSIAYEVGGRAITELECQRIEHGERPLWGPLMGQAL
jgi:hypothetical protein